MRPLGRNIPWKSISIPWIRRSKGWNFRSKATFQRKNSSETCHIVAKTPFSAVPAAVRCTDVFHYQTFLIFAYLRARVQALENNRFSMLKSSALRRGGIPAATARGKAPLRHLRRSSRCAKLPAPQGSHYSVTAGERSEPAEGACPHHHRPQGGRTLIVCACESCAGIPRVTALHQPAAVADFAERMPVRPPWGRTYICGSPSAGSPCSPAVTE